MSFLQSMATALRCLLGVGLPVFAFEFEYSTHRFSGGLYDFMPTPWHAALWLLPCTMVLAELRLEQRRTPNRIVHFCHGVSVPVILLHVVAIGMTAIMGLYMLGMMGYALVASAGSSPMERENMSGFVIEFLGNSLIALTPLVLLTLWALNIRRLVRSGFFRAGHLLMGAGLGTLALLVLEWPMVRVHDQLVEAVRQLEEGHEPTDLEHLKPPRGQQVIARLAFSPHQFSSAGELYAVGPVDVFGPLVFILSGRVVPTHASSNLTMKSHLMRRLFFLTCPADVLIPIPWSWRGLSGREMAEQRR